MNRAEEILIRPERSADRDQVETVHRAAFEGEGEAALVRALRESPAYLPELSLVAVEGMRVVAHIVLSRARLRAAGGEREVLVLGPEAVLPSRSHRGIGARLLREALGRAREAGYPAVVEAGRPGYFRTQGFRPADHWGLAVSLPLEAALVSAVELVPDALAGGGLVVFPEPFHRLFGHR